MRKQIYWIVITIFILTIPEFVYCKTAYYSWIDQLRIRKKPGLNGKVIGSLKEGEKIIFLNKKSSFKTQVELRSISFEKPWFKIKTKQGIVGWVYGGGVVETEESIYNEVIPKPIKIDKDYGEFYPIGWSRKGHFAYFYDHLNVFACEREARAVIVDLNKNKEMYSNSFCWASRSANSNSFSLDWIINKPFHLFKKQMKKYKIIPHKKIKQFSFPIKKKKREWLLELEENKEINKKNNKDLKNIKVYLRSSEKKRFIYENRGEPSPGQLELKSANSIYLMSPYKPYITVPLKYSYERDCIIVIGFRLPR